MSRRVAAQAHVGSHHERPSHRSCCAAHADGAAGHRHHHATTDAALTVKDPVCGMKVDPHADAAPARAPGADLLISAAPAAAPSSRPTRSAIWRQQSAHRPRPDAIYTCPMHPEVRQVGPGTCPICGMALEPLDVTADAAPNPELADMTPALLDRRWRSPCRCSLLEMRRASLGRPAHARCGRSAATGCSSSWRRRSCSGPAGRSSQRGWASLAEPQPQHVHADRARHRRRLGLQRGRRRWPRPVPARFRGRGRQRSPSISRPPR